MMKNWNAAQWSLFVLACTIPYTFTAMFITKAITGTSMSPEAATLMADILKFLIGGVFGVIAGNSIKKKKGKN